MNDRAARLPDSPAGPLLAAQPDPALPKGMRLGTFEIERVISRSAHAIVYLAADDALAMPVAIQEYLPARLMRRDAGLRLVASAAWHEDLIAHGLRAFVDEARMLARAEHPSLVRVHQLFHANGSAYRVMPVYAGQRLSDLRRQMTTAPDEAALRALLDGLLGALETIHQTGQVHGGVAPENILLLADDRPLLLGAGAAAREIGSDLVESLMATLESPANAERRAEAGTPPTGPARDLYLLAGVIRFCITGEAPSSPESLRQREPLANAVARQLPREVSQPYTPALLETLDAALSPFAPDRPLNVAQFRDWLARGVPAVPGGATRAAGVAAVAAATAPAAVAPSPEPPEAVGPPPAPVAAASPSPPPAFSSSDEFEPRFEAPIAPWPDVVRATDPPFSHAPGPSAPPLPPPLQRATRARQRRFQWLLGSGLAVLAAAVLAVATGAWNLAPELTLGPDAQRISVPAPRAALETAAPSVQEAASRAVPEPVPAAPPAPIATELASETARSDAPPAFDPARTLATHPPAAGPAAPRAPATRTAATSAAANGGSPRAACAGRTEFALYRCMVQQCQAKRWTVHPQCVRLRLDDRVD